MMFSERLDAAVERSGSLLCVGLDPDGLPGAAAAERFCIETLEASLEFACAVKPNLAFFEQFGSAGYAVLERLRQRVPDDRMLILDGKRGDIANTAAAYARALFDILGADAITVNALMGRDALLPFLTATGRGVFVVTRTSNASAAEVLDSRLDSGETVYERIVRIGLECDPGGAVGFVVGATDPRAIASVRSAAPNAPLLIPGVGAQGGSLEQAVHAGLDGNGSGLVLAVSRGISAAPEGPAHAAAQLRSRIDAARQAVAAR